jgi:hypothetical protein
MAIGLNCPSGAAADGAATEAQRRRAGCAAAWAVCGLPAAAAKGAPRLCFLGSQRGKGAKCPVLHAEWDQMYPINLW